ncbi:hypothetical protein LOAG_03189 [Loa loa]|uniref:Uncharacterized protein n=1 Tax=Loa loa TaxID=7209 RepID=A0A1S0U4W3_LOALO|nr:hypothetical protein LOAG_03189 [Loa loa]EFO25297.1 hypothetical protein LOAG_03189 [Loa loa]
MSVKTWHEHKTGYVQFVRMLILITIRKRIHISFQFCLSIHKHDYFSTLVHYDRYQMPLSSELDVKQTKTPALYKNISSLNAQSDCRPHLKVVLPFQFTLEMATNNAVTLSSIFPIKSTAFCLIIKSELKLSPEMIVFLECEMTAAAVIIPKRMQYFLAEQLSKTEKQTKIEMKRT